MYAQRIAQRAAPAFARRAFSTTRVQRASPFHYPEGPRSNLPFNPLTKFFFVRYWLFMGAFRQVHVVYRYTDCVAASGFGLPIGMACKETSRKCSWIIANFDRSLANIQELGDLLDGSGKLCSLRQEWWHGSRKRIVHTEQDINSPSKKAGGSAHTAHFAL